MGAPFRAKAIRFESGERFPLLLRPDSALPVLDVIDFSLAYHRIMSINSGKARVAAIGMFLDWAFDLNIDVDERFGSGDLFNVAEVESLAGYLRLSRRHKIRVGNDDVPAAIIGKTHSDRIDWILHYMNWRVDSVAQSMAIGDARVPALIERMRRIQEQLKKLKGKGGGKVRLGLTEEQQVRLFEIVRPDSPENPFHAETRYRNFMLLLMFFELGVRRAEPLVLKSQHVHLHGPNPRITIEANPHDPDERRTEPPLVKTAGRTLPLSPLLAETMNTYILKHRSKVPGAKKNPFIVLESTEGRAMSLYSLYDIFVVLRDRFQDVFPPDFSTHVLRHTWNDRFRAVAKQRGLTHPEEKQINNYIMGWTKTSQQAGNYSQREIERQATDLLVRLQHQLLETA